MKNRKSAAALSLLVASTLLIAPVLKKDKNPCRVDVGLPHISTFLEERGGLTAVKVNAFSTCDRPHSRVTLTVELWKEETIFKKRVRKTVARHIEVLPPNKKFHNEKTFRPCKSNQVTLYFAKAYGKALIDGVWHFAASRNKTSTPIKCAT